MRCIHAVGFLGLLAAACSESATEAVDAPAAGDAGADASSAQCLVMPSYGALGAKTGAPGSELGNTTMTITLDAGPPRDTFFLKLVPMKGPFSGAVTTGTFPITGADASYTDCGVCTHIIADIVPGSGPSKFYFADQGTVTITSTAPLAGSVENLRLNEVNIATGAPIPGCTTTITSMSFSAS